MSTEPHKQPVVFDFAGDSPTGVIDGSEELLSAESRAEVFSTDPVYVGLFAKIDPKRLTKK